MFILDRLYIGLDFNHIDLTAGVTVGPMVFQFADICKVKEDVGCLEWPMSSLLVEGYECLDHVCFFFAVPNSILLFQLLFFYFKIIGLNQFDLLSLHVGGKTCVVLDVFSGDVWQANDDNRGILDSNLRSRSRITQNILHKRWFKSPQFQDI